VKRRLIVLVSTVFALLAVLLEGGLALYWTMVLAPRLTMEAQQQAQVLAQSQAALLVAALAEADPQRRRERLVQALDELLLLRDAQRDAPFFTGVGLELDYDSVAAPSGSLDQPLRVDERDAYAINVDLYQRDSGELLGIAQFGVSKSFFYSFSTDLRRQMVWQAGLMAAVLALLWGSLAWLLNRHENQRARFQRELESARDAAQAASRSKSQFLANMSHEIRTPLTAVIGLSTLLGKTELDVRQHALQQQLADSAHLLLGIIDDILDLSRIEAGKLPLQCVEFSLEQVWRDVCSVLGRRADNKGLSLLFQLPADAPTLLRGDRVRLTQILLNLLSNAIKFTERGEVRLDVRVLSRTIGDCHLYFEVSDSGIGIAADLLPRIFDVFTQADESDARRHGGAGLGLAICKRLVELLGGTLTVHSDLGHGSQFGFAIALQLAAPAPSTPMLSSDLPALRVRYGTAVEQALGMQQESLHREHSDHAQAAPSAAGAALFTPGCRVLLAEDHSINQSVAMAMLDELGVAVEPVGDGETALAALRAGHFDAVLMDIQMPGMDGLSATRLLKDDPALCDIPVIALTAHAMSGDRERFLHAGMDDYLTKPLDPARLLQVLRRWLPATGVSAAQTLADKALDATQTADPAMPQIAGMDIAAALHRLGGKPALYWRLLDDFRQRHAVMAADLVDAISSAQHARIRELAHAIKGVAATLGAVQIAGAAQTIESGARGIPMHAALDQLQDGFAQLRAAQLPTLDAICPSASHAPAADDLAQQLQQLDHALARHDLSAATQLSALREGLPAAHAAVVQQLQSCIAELNFSGARDALKQLRESHS
jgi:signal transduction histidine kinase/CheY-like chemotaxis protein/HPt (histidine-containing phosphotransfer) domain-containing protein